MNYGIVIKTLGNTLMIEAVALLFPFAISIGYMQKDMLSFAITFVITILSGFALSRVPVTKKQFKVKEGLMLVSLSWIAISFFGSLPMVISGSTNTFADAFFETVSGFTTTGATIFSDVEILPKGILFWRSFTHWIGGMGILVFTLAILPALGVGSFQVFKAESPGPIPDRIVPKLKDTAKILYITYLGITLLEIILLKLGGMSLFESALHTFGTVGTGGLSTRNASVGAFDSTFIHIVIAVFMVLSGVNFSLYYAIYKGHWKEALKDQELRFYLGIILSAVLLITIDTGINVYGNVPLALRDAFFQTSSIITTTGYVTVDYEKWTFFSQGILFLLMFVGGCAGSTSGSIKVIRILVLFKLIKREFSRILHPRAVIPVRLGGKTISQEVITAIGSFFVLYITIFISGTLVLTLEGVSLLGASSAVASTLGNIGPGFSEVGPTSNFGFFSSASKFLLSLFMLLGRLELYTLLVLFVPRFWKNDM